MIQLACRRIHNVLPDKLLLSVLTIMVLCLFGCGEEKKHSNVQKNSLMYSKKAFTIKKPPVCYPMQKVDILFDAKIADSDELTVLVDGKKVDITGRSEQSVSFKAPFKEGHHEILLVKNGSQSNKSGFNVIAYH